MNFKQNTYLWRHDLTKHVILFPPKHKWRKQLFELAVGFCVPICPSFQMHKVFQHPFSAVVAVVIIVAPIFAFRGLGFGCKKWHEEAQKGHELLWRILYGSSFKLD